MKGSAIATLALELFLDPHTPPDGPAAPGAAGKTSDRTLEPWVAHALRLIDNDEVSTDDLNDALEGALRLNGPNSDYVLELLAIVAREIGGVDVERQAVETRLLRLTDAVNGELGRSRQTGDVRRAKNLAEVLLDAVDRVSVDLDPVVVAEALLAAGGAQTFAGDRRLEMAFPLYVRALKLYRRADPPAPEAVTRLEDLLGTMVHEQVKAAISATVMGGRELGGDALESAAEAADALNRADLAFEVAVARSDAHRSLFAPELAEQVVTDALDRLVLDDQQRLTLRSQLAAILSEQHRNRAALEMQEKVVEEWERRGGVPSIELMRLGNFRRETGDLTGAVKAFEKAVVAAGPLEPGVVDQRQLGALALLGEARLLAGDRAGIESIDEAVAAAGDGPQLDNLHLYRLAVDAHLDAGDLDGARHALAKARRTMRFFVGRSPRPEVWAGLLSGWARFDFREVELALAHGGAGAGQALAAAEAAKGRILLWASMGFTDQAASHVFADEQHAEDLRKVRSWVAGGRRRRVVSLFAAESGLAVFDLSGGGRLDGRWVAPFNYPELAEDLFDPWVALLADAAGGGRSWETAALATEHVLSWAGALLWRALPDLAEGGDELVMVPHRFFRLLPWPAVELPDGSRLGERFGQVVMAPSLAELARRTEPAPDSGFTVVALADPDGSLPFARLEALDVTGAEPQSDLAMGPSASVAAIKWAFTRSAAGLVHLSCHGDFDEGNPWRSSLLASDGAVSLADVFSAAKAQGPVIVLGACESGRSFRAPSDEPFGFPALLCQRGARAVVAPSWQVDDLSSLLLLTELHRRRRSLPLAAAQWAAADWLRRLDPASALDRLDELAAAHLASVGEDAGAVSRQLAASRHWLAGLSRRRRPFRGVLDWAPFQVAGVPEPVPQEEP